MRQSLDNPLLACALAPDKTIYKPNEKVRLELCVYAPAPVTGLHVKASMDHDGRALSFNDAGRLVDDEKSDGVYTASLNAPRKPGVYTVTASVVGSTKDMVTVASDDPSDSASLLRLRRERSIQTGDFTRILKTSFVVTK